nr:MAG TPA: hypothetical protein [Caudoviricetes sp.]
MVFMEENNQQQESDKKLSKRRMYFLQVRKYDNRNTETIIKEYQYYFDEFSGMIDKMVSDFDLQSEKAILENSLSFDKNTETLSKDVKIVKPETEYYFLLRSFGWKLYYE